MKNNFIEGEEAMLEVLGEIQKLVARKEDYIFKDDISIALLVHAIDYIYQSSQDESEASHLILNVISEVLLGEYNDSLVNYADGHSRLKH